MSRRGVDVPSLVAGLALSGLGVLLLLDSLEALDLDFGWVLPLLFACAGAILLALGLSGPRSPR